MKQAILVIDMLNDFVTGKLACKNALSIIKPIQKLILTARQKSVPIIYVNDAHTNKDHELNL
jgi:nicotinamidase-related amidase